MENKFVYTHRIFDALKMVHENETCFDCGKSPANWVSMENGVFICAKCAGKQRNFPDNKFTLLSIILDKFSNEEINYMISGGNKNLNEYLEMNSIDKRDIDKNALYNMSTVKTYRQDLSIKAHKAKNKNIIVNTENDINDDI